MGGDEALACYGAAGVAEQVQHGWRHNARTNQQLTLITALGWDHRRVGGAAGNHHVHGDATAQQLRRQPRGPGFEARFGNAVGVEPRSQHRIKAGGDVDDPSEALLPEARQRGLRDAQRTGQIDRQEALLLFNRHVVDGHAAVEMILPDDAHSQRRIVHEGV